MLNKSLTILNKYVKEFLKLKTDIKIIEKRNFYVLYFLDKSFYLNNLDKIDYIFNSLKQENATKLNKNILYGYIYDYYMDYQDFEDELKNGLCKDLTYRFFKPYKKLYYNNINNSFNFKKKSIVNSDIKKYEFYNIELNTDIDLKINKKDYILDIENLGDSNGKTTAA